MSRTVRVCERFGGSWTAAWCVVCGLWWLSQVAVASPQDLFFASSRDIRKFNPQTQPQILYEGLEQPQALDFNYCSRDQRIYWISFITGRIRSGSPNGEGSIENVINDNAESPHGVGIAVDYIGNNIYFSQQTNSSNGRLEVVTCDGRYRRVLKTGLAKVGPLALDMTRGYLYYSDEKGIHRIDTDGQNHEFIQIIADPHPVVGVAIDTSLNRLYWSIGGRIEYLNLSQPFPHSVSTVNVGTSNPRGLSAANGTLYWASNGTVGAIYSINLPSGEPSMLNSGSDIQPLDISTSPPNSLSSEGCADNNGGCPRFCFTVPSGNGTTTPRCGCTTGVLLHNQTCERVPRKFLLYGRVFSDSAQIFMLSLDTDTDIPVPLPFQVSGLGGYHVAYDIRDDMVYWSEINPPAIKRAVIYSSDEPEVVVATDIRQVSGIAIDPHSRNLYWCDSVLDIIEVVYFGTSHIDGFTDEGRWLRKVLISGDIHQPQSLTIDPRNHYMYWADLGVDQRWIERARLDGSERTVFANATSKQFKITYVTVHQDDSTVYWVDSSQTGFIYSSTSSQYNVGAQSVHGLTIIGDQIFWSDGEDGTIGVASTSTNVGEVYRTSVRGIQGLVAVDENHHINDNPCTNNIPLTGCSHFCFPEGPNKVCACPDGMELSDGGQQCIDITGYAAVTATYPVGPFLVFYYREFDENSENWRQQTTMSSFIGLVDVVSIAIHVLNDSASMIFYISAEDNSIYRLSLTSAGEFGEVTPIITCCLATPEDLAVDWLGSNLYWTDSERGVIEVARLDGKSRKVLYSNLNQPTVIALDPRRGRLYYVTKGSMVIQTVLMDGSTTTSSPLPSPCIVLSFENHTNEIHALSIHFEPTHHFNDSLICSYSYYKGGNFGSVSGSYNLNNLDEDVTLFVNSEGVHYVTSEAFDNAIYYVEQNGGIARKLAQSGPEELVGVEEQEDISITDFAIAHTSKQPGRHECTPRETCLGYDPLCLVNDHIYGTCHCPIDAYRKIEMDNQGIRKTACVYADNFIIWSTSQAIYYYPLPSDLTNSLMNSEPHEVPRHSGNQISAVTYDPRGRSIVWMDNDTQSLHSVSVHGMESEDLGRFPSHIRPQSMTLDWIGRQVLFTETSGYQIETASVRRNGTETLNIGSVMSAYGLEGVVSPYPPGDVLFDETDSSIIWHEGGREIYTTALGEIEKVPLLSDPNKNTASSSDERLIKYMTFDPKLGYIFWWNELKSSIEGLNVTMARDRQSTTAPTPHVIVTDVVDILGLSSTTLSYSDQASYIFWYDWIQGVLYRCNVTRKLEDPGYKCRDEQLSWKMPSGEVMVAMVSFDRARNTSSSLTYECHDTNAIQCDYLCIERQGTARCSCPLFKEMVDEEPGKCADSPCSTHHLRCGDRPECYPSTYGCDGIDHCTNGFDEMNCTMCDEEGSLPCGPEDDNLCYKNTSRCDNVLDCDNSHADELICCGDDQFGCYWVETDQYRCFEEQLRCRTPGLCLSDSYKENCSKPTTPPSGSPAPDPSSPNYYGIAAAVLGAFITLLILIIIIITSIKCIWKQSPQRRRVLTSLSKASTSPTPRSDISSLYSGISSYGTESTHFGNCSSPHADSFGKNVGFHPERSTHTQFISNPPPSLITGRQSQFLDEDEGRSFVISEADPCPAPAPSVDWENMSALSVSASQGGIRLTNMNGGQGSENFHQRPPMISNPHHPQAGNPLLYQQRALGLHGNNHHYQGNGHPYGNRPGSINSSVISGNSRSRVHGRYPPSVMSHFRGGRGNTPHSYITDANYDEAETETVFSQSTLNTENGVFGYDDRTPPGRPPSPATITEYSERRIPLTPTSKISEYSEDENSDHNE